MQKCSFWLLGILTLMLHGCVDDPLDVDISGHGTDLNISRLDQKLFEALKQDPDRVHQELLATEGVAYPFYFSKMLGLGSVYDPNAGFNLYRFVNDKVIREVYDTMRLAYADISDIEAQLESAFGHYRYYFPDAAIPRIVTTQTGFYTTVFDLDSVFLINLEMYLGARSSFVKRLSPKDYPQYLKDQMERKNIPVDVMHVWLTNKYYSGETIGPTFASHIIFHGKIMYLLHAALREHTEAERFKYTEDQLRWCESNEANIWKVILERECLHSSDQMMIGQWVNPAPFTHDLPKNSPPMVGVWVGWKIVKNYMEAHPELTIAGLMDLQDHHVILQSYKPPK